MPDNIKNQYREMLESLKQSSQDSYDKTVISLSGGALGISFAFVKDIVGEWPANSTGWLFAAWVLWGLSVLSVLFSFLCSQKALQKAIEKVDAGKMYEKNLGGCLNLITIILNYSSGICFLLGVFTMVIFVAYNMKG